MTSIDEPGLPKHSRASVASPTYRSWMRRRAGGCALLIVTESTLSSLRLRRMNVCNRVKRYAPLTYRFDTSRATVPLPLIDCRFFAASSSALGPIVARRCRPIVIMKPARRVRLATNRCNSIIYEKRTRFDRPVWSFACGRILSYFLGTSHVGSRIAFRTAGRRHG